jgi:hypothetical protein
MKKPERKPNVIEEVTHDNIRKGQVVLENASAAIGANSDQHGDTKASFTMIAELWKTYINHVMAVNGTLTVEAHDVAQMMVLLKIARATYGHGIDHYTDAAGYTAIAAMVGPEERTE